MVGPPPPTTTSTTFSHETPSLDSLLKKLDEEENSHAKALKAHAEGTLAVHDSILHLNAAGSIPSDPLEQAIATASPSVSRAIVFFGAAVLVLPLLGHNVGLEGRASMTYDAHSGQSEKTDAIDRCSLESALGLLDPESLAKEVVVSEQTLRLRLERCAAKAIERETRLLQSWHHRAARRLRVLEVRVALALLGVPAGSEPSLIRRAFKRRALELHPDKGGNHRHFALLQEMKEVLMSSGMDASSDQAGGKKQSQEADGARDGKNQNDSQQVDGDGDASPSEPAGRRSHDNVHASNDDEEVEPESEDFAWMQENSPKVRAISARMKAHHAMVLVWERATMLVSELGEASETRTPSVIPAFDIDRQATSSELVIHLAQALASAAVVDIGLASSRASSWPEAARFREALPLVRGLADILVREVDDARALAESEAAEVAEQRSPSPQASAVVDDGLQQCSRLCKMMPEQDVQEQLAKSPVGGGEDAAAAPSSISVGSAGRRGSELQALKQRWGWNNKQKSRTSARETKA